MGERRKARRYEIYIPVEVRQGSQRPAVCHTAQLRDISTSGMYFHSDVAVDPGVRMELTFALPTDKDRGPAVLIRASAKALRISPLQGDVEPLYGVAASFDRIDFVRQIVSATSAA